MAYSAHSFKKETLIVNSKKQFKGDYYLNGNGTSYNFDTLQDVVNVALKFKFVKRPNGMLCKGKNYNLNKAVDDFF